MVSFVQCSWNDELIERAGKVIDTVSHVFGRNAMELNSEPGKLRVPGGAQGGADAVLSGAPSASGSQTASTCNDAANVQYRLVKAKQAFGALAKRCSLRTSLTLEHKWIFFRCLIVSILLYGVQTWTRPSWASLE